MPSCLTWTRCRGARETVVPVVQRPSPGSDTRQQSVKRCTATTKRWSMGVAGKRGSCNKDSTTLVGRVGLAFLIDVELACRAGPESRRARRGRGVGEQRPRAMHGSSGQTNVGDVGEVNGRITAGLLLRVEGKAFKEGRDSENRAKGACAQGRRRESGAVVECAKEESTGSHGRVMHTCSRDQ